MHTKPERNRGETVDYLSLPFACVQQGAKLFPATQSIIEIRYPGDFSFSSSQTRVLCRSVQDRVCLHLEKFTWGRVRVMLQSFHRIRSVRISVTHKIPAILVETWYQFHILDRLLYHNSEKIQKSVHKFTRPALSSWNGSSELKRKHLFFSVVLQWTSDDIVFFLLFVWGFSWWSVSFFGSEMVRDGSIHSLDSVAILSEK